MIRRRTAAAFMLLLLFLATIPCYYGLSLSSSSSRYRSGWTIELHRQSTSFLGYSSSCRSYDSASCHCHKITMRKQKASDRRTRRQQRGEIILQQQAPVTATLSSSRRIIATTTTKSAMEEATWKHKKMTESSLFPNPAGGGGRGRSRKRTAVYQTLGNYQNHFLRLLTAEYQAEEEEVLGRIIQSIEDPIGLELAGYALFDMVTERRGTLFAAETVYRLTKSVDATTTTYYNNENNNDKNRNSHLLPPHHKFSKNDVIVLTQQPGGSGDFFDVTPIVDNAVTAEARVLNYGPTYLDVALTAGTFEAAFGDDPSSFKYLRLRADRFVSNTSYQRMVSALSQLTSVAAEKNSSFKKHNKAADQEKSSSAVPNIAMDEVLRTVILSTHAYTNPDSPLLHDPEVCNLLEELSHRLAKPPMAASSKLASYTLKQLQSNPSLRHFCDFNAPQRSAIQAALTRRLTLIHGPPGSGKTAVAAAIGYGFVHQCRTISEQHAKVLACAFSNVGADNLVEALLQLGGGVKVIRIGKPSAVAESLWSYTLDAAIDRDVTAQKALQNAAKATAQLAKLRNDKKLSSSSSSKLSISERTIRDVATAAVKAAIEACNIAATKALREANVIVTTSVGAADPRLLRACGIMTEDDELSSTMPAPKKQTRNNAVEQQAISERINAPDGFPPLSLPFVIIDEACQSVEPATLIPIISSNSCRSLVMLGDPCQLPPTVRSREGKPLELSLMERLAATLPHPNVIPPVDNTLKDSAYLDALPIKQAISLLRSRSSNRRQPSYRKLFNGSLLLSIQYRMHPSIAALPSALFYNGLLTTPSFMSEVRSFPPALRKIMPCSNPDMCVRLIDVGGQDNERQGMPSKYTQTVYSSAVRTSSSLEEKTTYWNEAEAERVILLIKDLLSGESDPEITSIGIISPYNGQVQLIKSMIAGDSALRDILQKLPVSIEVKSVDGYQGRERDVIIFSAVRSNRQERIGFLHDWRRMNVALTRAKSALLVVGDLQTLSAANKYWDSFTCWATGNRCVVDDSECPEDEASP